MTRRGLLRSARLMLGLAPDLAALTSDPADAAGPVRPDQRRRKREREGQHQNRDGVPLHVATPF